MSMYNAIVEGNIDRLMSDISQDVFKSAKKKDENQKKAFVFTIYSIMQIIDVSLDDALDSMTDGGNDCNTDAVYISEDSEISWTVSIFQTKYFQPKDVSKLENKVISETDIKQLILHTRHILNGEDMDVNPRLQEKIRDIKTKIREIGCAPNINVYLISNGSNEISKQSEQEIERIESEKENVKIFIKNAEDITPKSQKKLVISHNITSSGGILEVNEGNVRGVVCNLPLLELMKLYDECGKDQLLIQNIRGFLKWVKINKDIRDTATNSIDSKYFWFFNNGISIICETLNWTDDLHSNKIITLRNPQIINGGQTTRSIYEAYKLDRNSIQSNATVLARLYQTEDLDLIKKITKNTNSQNAINFRDLQSNDTAQELLQEYFKTQGYYLDIKRDKTKIVEDLKLISNENLFQIYASIYLNIPHKAKSSKTFIFKTVLESIQGKESEIPKIMLRAYNIWEYTVSKTYDRESDTYLITSYAKYCILYTMKKLEPQIIDISKELDPLILEKIYNDAMKVIYLIIEQEKNTMKNSYSLANLFKSARSTELIDQCFPK